jgi:hypothetical protein
LKKETTYIKEKIVFSINLETVSPYAEWKEALISHHIIISKQIKDIDIINVISVYYLNKVRRFNMTFSNMHTMYLDHIHFSYSFFAPSHLILMVSNP